MRVLTLIIILLLMVVLLRFFEYKLLLGRSPILLLPVLMPLPTLLLFSLLLFILSELLVYTTAESFVRFSISIPLWVYITSWLTLHLHVSSQRSTTSFAAGFDDDSSTETSNWLLVLYINKYQLFIYWCYHYYWCCLDWLIFWFINNCINNFYFSYC